jgi:predicted component of type VI protein secretion system
VQVYRVGVRWPDKDQREKLFSFDQTRYEELKAENPQMGDRETVLLNMVAVSMERVLNERRAQKRMATKLNLDAAALHPAKPTGTAGPGKFRFD